MTKVSAWVIRLPCYFLMSHFAFVSRLPHAPRVVLLTPHIGTSRPKTAGKDRFGLRDNSNDRPQAAELSRSMSKPEVLRFASDNSSTASLDEGNDVRCQPLRWL